MERKESGEHKGAPPHEKNGFQKILSYIESTDLEYVLIERDGRKYSFRRSAPSILSKPPSAAQAENGGYANNKAQENESSKFVSIRSPIVGRFYRSTGADRPPLVVEGGQVTSGQRVAIVEAMKIKKEVFSAVTGKIVKILVKDGDAVEYGQELYFVEPVQDQSRS